jgi:hypothetical protein
MSPLFRRNEEKAARKAVAKEEIQRLKALDVDELAVLLMPGLGPDGPTHGQTTRVDQLFDYLLKDHPGASQMDKLDLLGAVRRALERLHEAKLVTPISYQRTPIWRISSPLGTRTLAEGTVRERLEKLDAG